MEIEKYKLYNDTIILEYDDSKHLYQVDGKTVYGTTSIIGVLDKPALMYWAVNMAVEYLEKNLKAGEVIDEIQIKSLLEGAKSAHRIRKDKAADIGSLAHDWLNKYMEAKLQKKELPKSPINKETKNAVKGALVWMSEHKVIPLASEQKIYSKKHKFAGTYDLLAKIGGKKTIIDFKTGKKIYPEAFLQAASYLKAKEEEDGEVYDGGVMILRLSKVDKEKDIESFEVVSIPRKDIDDLFEVFLSCLRIYKWRMENKQKEFKKLLEK